MNIFKKDHRKDLGAQGEKIAEKYLKKKGFRMVERNLRNKAGEIDLLMWDDEFLVIIEVRTVMDLGNYSVGDKVPPSKRKQLIRLGHHLITKLSQPLPPIRFDICVIEMKEKPVVHHVENAFRADKYR